MRNKNWLSISPTIVTEYASYSLLFLMLFVPFEQQVAKIALVLFVMFFVTLLAVKSGNILVDFRVLVWILVLIGNGAFFVLWGILHGRTDAFKVLPVFVIYPILYIFITGSISRPMALNAMFKLLVGSSFVISIYSALYMLSMLGFIPGQVIFSIVKESVVSVGQEFFSYSMPSITSMLYLVPFIFSSLLLWDDRDRMPIKRVWLGVALLLSFIPIIFSSTRVFWLILIVTPALTFFFIFFLERQYRASRKAVFYTNLKGVFAAVVVAMIVPGLYYYAEITEIFLSSAAFMDALTFTDSGTSVRGEQLKMLLDGWSEVPLLGAGHGASLPAYRRSAIAPWAYELSFVALLFQTGLVGVIIYIAEILWLFYMGLKLTQANAATSVYIIPTLVGMSCFLIATGTNPYLYAFDHLWTVFVTLIVINVFLLKRRAKIASSCHETHSHA
jgi:O-Antigen ligase